MGIRHWVGRDVPLTVRTGVLLGSLYLILAALSAGLGGALGAVTTLYLPAGYALAVMLVLGTRMWPAIWLGSLSTNLILLPAMTRPLPVMAWLVIGVAIATAATLQAWLGTTLLRPHTGKPPVLQSMPALLALFGYAGLASCTIKASVGTMALLLAGLVSRPDAGMTWVIWWLGDVIPVIIVTPLILAWCRDEPPAGRSRPAVCVGLVALLVITAGIAFSGWSPLARAHTPVQYLILLPALAIALCCGQRAASVAALALFLVALQGTAAGHGPFAHASPTAAVLMLGGYVGVADLFLLSLVVGAEGRRRQARALIENERLLHGVIDGVSEPIYLKDRQGRYRLINPAGIRLLQHLQPQVSTVLGKRDDELVDPDLARVAIQLDRDVIDSGRPATREWEVPIAGQRRIFLVTASPFRDPAGQTVGVISASRDVTEVRQAATTREQLQAMRRINQTKDRFISMVSHEMRTPLTVIHGYASLLKGGMLGPLNDRQLEALTRLIASADRQTKLVNDLLDLGKGLAGTFTIQCRPIQLTAITQGVVAELTTLADQKAQRLHLMASDDLPMTRGDPQRLGQVLSNLIANAITHTPVGGEIRVRLGQREGQLWVEVQDTGPGIAEGQLPDLFQPFSQLAANVVKGAGLGLAIAKAFVTAHGGQIGCTSTLGSGSTFWFTLPIVPTSAADAA